MRNVPHNEPWNSMPLSHCTHWIFDMDGTLTLPILEAIDAMPSAQAAELTSPAGFLPLL